MDHSKKTTYIYSLDALRVLSILAVVAIHISIKILANIDHNLFQGFIPFVFNQATRFAVPLFFLISGFVLELNYFEKLSFLTYFKKRASRVIVPFLFWSIVYLCLSNGFRLSMLFEKETLINLFLGKVSYHLYFIPTLIIFYIIFPIFHKLIKFFKNPFALTTILIIQTFILYQDYYVKPLDINQNYRVAILSFSLFILGMVASHFKERILKTLEKYFKYFLFTFFAIGIFMLYHVFILSVTNHTTSYIYNQHHPINYLYTISFALVFFYIFEKTQFARKIFIKLSKLSFFVFFIHVLIQTIVWDNITVLFIKMYGTSFLVSIWFTPIIFIFLSIISFSIAYIIHKIPYASKITG